MFRALIGNAHAICLFLKRELANLGYILEHYLNVPKGVYLEIKNNDDSRWIIINKNDIPFIMTENMAFIFNAEKESDRIKQKQKEKSIVMRRELEQKLKAGTQIDNFATSFRLM